MDFLEHRQEVCHYFADNQAAVDQEDFEVAHPAKNFVSSNGVNTFWTRDVVRHFRKINNQSGIIADKYYEYRLRPLEPFEKAIEDAKLKIFIARHTSDKQVMLQAIQHMQDLQKKYQKEEELAEERIFAHLNTEDMVNNFIDLHGQKVAKAVKIAMYHLMRLQQELSEGKIQPNWKNCHIYKIICGAGSHSKSGVGMMKVKLQEELEARNFDYHPDMSHGVFLVRFTMARS